MRFTLRIVLLPVLSLGILSVSHDVAESIRSVEAESGAKIDPDG